MGRRRQRALLLFSIAVSAIVPPVRALALDCQIAVTDFSLLGRSDAAVAFEVTLSNPKRLSVAAKVETQSTSGQGAELLLPATGSESNVHVAFAWPSASLRTARVTEVMDEERGFRSCSSRAAALDDSTKNATTVVFSTVALAQSSKRLTQVSSNEPAVAVDRDFLHRVYPAYPADLARSGAAGAAGVLVDVMASGKASNAVVINSSQVAPLDEAAVAAALGSTYRPPTVAGRPASRQYEVSYSFTAGGQNADVAADTKCHARISYGWLIGLDRSAGENLYEIGLSADRSDINAVDVSLEKGDVSPPITFSKLAWERHSRTVFTAAAYVLNWGDLVGALRLDSVDVSGARTMNCSPYTIVTWDDTAGRLEWGSRPTAPPASMPPPANVVVLPAAFHNRVWPRYPHDLQHEYVAGSVTLIVRANADGLPIACDVYRTSGNDTLDAAASKAALESTYERTGAPVTYVVWYEFRPTLTSGEIAP